MILSALAFSVLSMFVKVLGTRGIPLMEIVAARALISLGISYFSLRRRQVSVWGRRKYLLFFRGAVGFCALTCVFYSVTHLPLAEATVIQYLHPAFTALLAFLFIGEQPKKATLLCIGMSIVGLILIVESGIEAEAETAIGHDMFAFGVAIMGALGSAIAYICVKKLSQTEDPLVIVMYFPLVCLPASLPFLINDWVTPQGVDWLYLLGVGVSTQVGQVSLTKGMQTETANRATSFSYLQIVFATVLGIIVFSEVPEVLTWVGASLIIAGAYVNVRQPKPGPKLKPRQV